MERDLSEGNLSKTGLEISEHDHRKHYSESEWANVPIPWEKFDSLTGCCVWDWFTTSQWSTRVKHPGWERSIGSAHIDITHTSKHCIAHGQTHTYPRPEKQCICTYCYIHLCSRKLLKLQMLGFQWGGFPFLSSQTRSIFEMMWLSQY